MSETPMYCSKCGSRLTLGPPCRVCNSSLPEGSYPKPEDFKEQLMKEAMKREPALLAAFERRLKKERENER